MNRNNMDVRSTAVFLAVLTVLVIGFAIILADSYEPGMTIFDLLECFTGWVEHPYFVSWTSHTLKFILMVILLYGLGIALFVSSREAFQRGCGRAQQDDRQAGTAVHQAQ